MQNTMEISRQAIENRFGKGNVWDTAELTEQFDVLGFCAPYVVAIRKADGVKCSLEFTHMPRFYFDLKEV